MSSEIAKQQTKDHSSMGQELSLGRTQVEIPKALVLRIQNRLTKSEFKNVDEYVTYVIEQVLIELESKEAEESSNAFSKEDQGSVEQRLRDLGYI